VSGEQVDLMQLALLRVGCEVAHCHVIRHPLAQSRDLADGWNGVPKQLCCSWRAGVSENFTERKAGRAFAESFAPAFLPVREVSSGLAEEITEFGMGVDSLGCDPGFDSQQDALVRVDTHHRRKRLNQYCD
jgi:hypothetical protein